MPAETPLTPDPTLDKLARFSPAPPLTIDRDELLFQAGRASARVGRVWKTAVALLVATQAATLGMWLLTPTGPATSPQTDATAAMPATAPVPAPAQQLDPLSIAALLHWDGDTLPPAPDAGPAGPVSPVLSVAGGGPKGLLN